MVYCGILCRLWGWSGHLSMLTWWNWSIRTSTNWTQRRFVLPLYTDSLHCLHTAHTNAHSQTPVWHRHLFYSFRFSLLYVLCPDFTPPPLSALPIPGSEDCKEVCLEWPTSETSLNLSCSHATLVPSLVPKSYWAIPYCYWHKPHENVETSWS